MGDWGMKAVIILGAIVIGLMLAARWSGQTFGPINLLGPFQSTNPFNPASWQGSTAGTGSAAGAFQDMTGRGADGVGATQPQIARMAAMNPARYGMA
jgi:hypothetical protein